MRILRLALETRGGHLLWQWSSAEAGADQEHALPFQAANEETRLLTSGDKDAAGISVLCEGHDPALLLNLPATTLERIDGGSRLTIEAVWDVLSSEVSHLLATLTVPS
ncbi:hypothetical protein SYNGFB01_02875 [Synechococcus sp. GFB01]|nr:hypothetical protein SYNGFB01_02875 [Synechococcus sp. GFB01]